MTACYMCLFPGCIRLWWVRSGMLRAQGELFPAKVGLGWPTLLRIHNEDCGPGIIADSCTLHTSLIRRNPGPRSSS